MLRIAVLALLIGCNPSQRKLLNYTTLTASTALIACDWVQTRAAAKTQWSDFEELNPILGQAPSVQRVDGYFTVATLANAALWYLLPEQVKSVVPGFVSGFQLKTVIGNNQTIGRCY
jgi:hypothetical protein